MKAQAALTVIRDAACLAVGIFGIVHQEITGHVSTALLATYTTLLGAPGAIGLVALLRGKSTVLPTPELPSQPAPEPSSSGSS